VAPLKWAQFILLAVAAQWTPACLPIRTAHVLFS
jgi:hypothetical protein